LPSSAEQQRLEPLGNLRNAKSVAANRATLQVVIAPTYYIPLSSPPPKPHLTATSVPAADGVPNSLRNSEKGRRKRYRNRRAGVETEKIGEQELQRQAEKKTKKLAEKEGCLSNCKSKMEKV
jgi:hypothetical protein